MTDFLVSYPRSGNSWFRYCVEFLTGRPTTSLPVEFANCANIPKNDAVGVDGIPHINIIEKAVLVKRHHFYSTWIDGIKYNCECEKCQYKINNSDRIILLIRDFKEAIFRHIMPQMGPGMKDQHMIDNLNRYMDIIYIYDNFNGSKVIIYYEDLISNTALELEKACNLLGIDKSRISEFEKDINNHKNISIAKYGDSKTGGIRTTFHSQNVEKRLLDLLINTAYEDHLIIINKYLKRYKSI